jgi:hypothetical protein
VQGPESVLYKLVQALQEIVPHDYHAAVQRICGNLLQPMLNAEQVTSLLHPRPASFYELRINGDFRSRSHVKQILTSSDQNNPFPKITVDNSEGYTIHDLKRQLCDHEQLFALANIMWDADAEVLKFGDPEPLPGLTCWTGQETGIQGTRTLQDARRTGIQLDDEFTVAVPLSENEETHVPPAYSRFNGQNLSGNRTKDMRIHFRMARGPATGPNKPPSSKRGDYTILDNVRAVASSPFTVVSQRSRLDVVKVMQNEQKPDEPDERDNPDEPDKPVDKPMVNVDDLELYCIAPYDLTFEQASHFAWMLKHSKIPRHDGLEDFYNKVLNGHAIRQLVLIYDSIDGQINWSGGGFNYLVKAAALRCGGVDLMLDVGRACDDEELCCIMEAAHQYAIEWQKGNPGLHPPGYTVGGCVEWVLKKPNSVYSVGPLEEDRGLEVSTGCEREDGIQRHQSLCRCIDLVMEANSEGAVQGVLLSLWAVPSPINCSC